MRWLIDSVIRAMSVRTRNVRWPGESITPYRGTIPDNRTVSGFYGDSPYEERY